MDVLTFPRFSEISICCEVPCCFLKLPKSFDSVKEFRRFVRFEYMFLISNILQDCRHFLIFSNISTDVPRFPVIYEVFQISKYAARFHRWSNILKRCSVIFRDSHFSENPVCVPMFVFNCLIFLRVSELFLIFKSFLEFPICVSIRFKMLQEFQIFGYVCSFQMQVSKLDAHILFVLFQENGYACLLET